MAHWRLWLGIVLQCIGFLTREQANNLAAWEWVEETSRRTASNDPAVPPACVYDCHLTLSGDVATLGHIAIAFIFVGTAFVCWSALRRT